MNYKNTLMNLNWVLSSKNSIFILKGKKMENNFDSAKWIREFKTALFEEKEKEEKAKKADEKMQK